MTAVQLVLDRGDSNASMSTPGHARVLQAAIEAEVRMNGALPDPEGLARATGLSISLSRARLARVVTREVVACVVTDGEKICLVRRSALVNHDHGLWHCVTGYVIEGHSPELQALDELSEELGLQRNQIEVMDQQSKVAIYAESTFWSIHRFLVKTSKKRFLLNWENDDYHWTLPEDLPAESVTWLPRVLNSLNLAKIEPPTAPDEDGVRP